MPAISDAVEFELTRQLACADKLANRVESSSSRVATRTEFFSKYT